MTKAKKISAAGGLAAIAVAGSLLLVFGCASPQYSPVPGPSEFPEIQSLQSKLQSRKPASTVNVPALSVVRDETATPMIWRLPQWQYPIAYWPQQTNAVMPLNRYRWSLEMTTNFVHWVALTNYPLGYTGETWATNYWDRDRYYRMHGRL